jgi:hypothetical protein
MENSLYNNNNSNNHAAMPAVAQEQPLTEREEKIKKWKRYLMYAFIGFILILGCFFIYKFFFSSSSSSSSSNDSISSSGSGSASMARSLSSAASALLSYSSGQHRDYYSGSESESESESDNEDGLGSDISDEGDEEEEINENFNLDEWKENVPNIAQDSALLNSLDNLSKYRHASPEVFRDVILLMETFCQKYYQAIGMDKKNLNSNLIKHDLLEKCQRLQTQTIYALHEFTRKFIEESATRYDRERQVEMMTNMREWTDIIKTILKNYTIHIIRTMRE